MNRRDPRRNRLIVLIVFLTAAGGAGFFVGAGLALMLLGPEYRQLMQTWMLIGIGLMVLSGRIDRIDSIFRQI